MFQLDLSELELCFWKFTFEISDFQKYQKQHILKIISVSNFLMINIFLFKKCKLILVVVVVVEGGGLSAGSS